MPCRWSNRCQAAAITEDASADGDKEVEHWRHVRRYNLRMMRKQVRTIILFMALMEAIRIGPVQMVFAGKEGYPAAGEDDFGIAYTMGYVFSWLYMCLFSIVFVPLFSWWLPSPAPESRTDKSLKSVSCFLKRFNLVLLPITIGLCLAQWSYYTLHTLIYVDSRPVGSRALPKNTRKNWAVRVMMLTGVAYSMFFGWYAFQILEQMGLAKVKMHEYAVIIAPIQVNIGILFGTLGQYKMEKRIAKKEALRAAAAKAEEGVSDEKAPLIEA